MEDQILENVAIKKYQQPMGTNGNMPANKGILLISTRKYKVFVQPLIEQIDKYFLPTHEKTIFVFSDEVQEIKSTNNVKQITIPPYKFPFATLFRYMIFSQSYDLLHKCSHLFYLDVDMAIIYFVGEEILGNGLTVVRHPGFYANGGYGSPNTVKESKAYVLPEGREKYFAGGFNGGASEVFLKMAKELAANIDDDESRGVRAEHNDESHLNHYLYSHPEIERIELTPSYCMPEQPNFKQSWGLGHLPSIILALSKNHSEIRA